jgi:hypothetical protein
MFTTFDKATAAAIGTAITSILAAATGWPAEVVGAVGVLITFGLTWLVPNKAAANA